MLKVVKTLMPFTEDKLQEKVAKLSILSVLRKVQLLPSFLLLYSVCYNKLYMYIRMYVFHLIELLL